MYWFIVDANFVDTSGAFVEVACGLADAIVVGSDVVRFWYELLAGEDILLRFGAEELSMFSLPITTLSTGDKEMLNPRFGT